MIRRITYGLLAASLALAPRVAQGQLKVVTSTTDLYDIAREVGGNKITATHIGEGYQDPHFIEAKPSFVLQLRNADVWAFVGLDLEIGWMPVLLDGARNPKIRQGGSGYLDVSTAVPVLDRPQGNIDRSMGDVHPLGNPHYWLDPENGRRIARLFKARFTQLDPSNAATYDANEKAFEARLNAAEKGWQSELATIKGKPVVAWHTSWRYFAEYTGMNIVAFMEPKPGVPPSPSHLYEVIQTVKRTGAKAIVMEPFYDRKVADLVAKQTGIKVLILPPSVGGVKGLDDYIQLMKYDVSQLATAVR
ncbi:MAG: zinc ABC transporter substrate-binding protein [Gemmatimonadaceae bacterium]|nr:zinc ABC transporter substrate-binding protein [Gemmatimonadaceae bacterium]NUO95410.1 zinc ABC transporter substrate-binding protein [Gemmatimonadaceae bacterium]NUP55029.1 zinc ABC transporter substrate-binding protein [Gemmatimonadaceae bacterium]NUP72703.1 zinc ABC transporter substrate-binding protein [Gemmatimonadaceae bacterium]NUS32760.1 zinc ABC transporter substrate-binding protein [Gemmatimonadaceae bacterium]